MTVCAEHGRFDYVWTEGDTQPEIGFILPDGLLVSDFAITLRIERPDGFVVTQPAIDLGGSKLKFAWAPTDLIAGRNQRTQVTRVDFAGDEQSLDIVLLDVQAKVGS